MWPSPWPRLRPLRLLVGALAAITACSLFIVGLPLEDLAWSDSEVGAQRIEHPQINALAIVVVVVVARGIGNSNTSHPVRDVDAFVTDESRKTIDKHRLSPYELGLGIEEVTSL